MTHYKLILIGFGNVGRALARLLLQKMDELERAGITFSVVGIATGSHGNALAPQGLDLLEVLTRFESGATLDGLSEGAAPPDARALIRRSEADVVFENTPVNYATGQPAIDHLQLALDLGMHAITANKGPVVHAYDSLHRNAGERGRKFLFESAVMDGAPVFSLFREALPAAELRAFRGILNSTTNLVLSRMESGESFDEAVKFAQSVGIAETDPSGDVDGWDAAIKVAALSTVLMGVPVRPDDVDRRGIRDITPEDIDRALEQGKRWKLVCKAQRTKAGVEAGVAPEMVPPESPLFGVDGTTSIVQFETDVLGRLTLIEEDPGPHTTAYGLLADFLNAIK
ncbi:MAG: homoserine dehydrogenase [Anaerolineales bacterium]|nr:homoserine dehydrogenase [Anaerolineales bacterium]